MGILPVPVTLFFADTTAALFMVTFSVWVCTTAAADEIGIGLIRRVACAASCVMLCAVKQLYFHTQPIFKQLKRQSGSGEYPKWARYLLVLIPPVYWVLAFSFDLASRFLDRHVYFAIEQVVFCSAVTLYMLLVVYTWYHLRTELKKFALKAAATGGGAGAAGVGTTPGANGPPGLNRQITSGGPAPGISGGATNRASAVSTTTPVVRTTTALVTVGVSPAAKGDGAVPSRHSPLFTTRTATFATEKPSSAGEKGSNGSGAPPALTLPASDSDGPIPLGRQPSRERSPAGSDSKPSLPPVAVPRLRTRQSSNTSPGIPVASGGSSAMSDGLSLTLVDAGADIPIISTFGSNGGSTTNGAASGTNGTTTAVTAITTATTASTALSSGSGTVPALSIAPPSPKGLAPTIPESRSTGSPQRAARRRTSPLPPSPLKFQRPYVPSLNVPTLTLNTNSINSLSAGATGSAAASSTGAAPSVTPTGTHSARAGAPPMLRLVSSGNSNGGGGPGPTVALTLPPPSPKPGGGPAGGGFGRATTFNSGGAGGSTARPAGGGAGPGPMIDTTYIEKALHTLAVRFWLVHSRRTSIDF